jgi:FkbM family methyltransferase
MARPKRKLAFVLAASDHGPMIVSRLDYKMVTATGGIGVGFQVLELGACEPDEISLVLSVLELRRQHFKDGVFAIDCGANIGVHTIEWAKRMTGWGSVLAIEAQERIYYALAGNIALNNCFNAVALNAAVTAKPGILKIPQPNYFVPASYGSLALRKNEGNEFIGQPIDYSEERLQPIQAVNIDSLGLPRLDFIKIDIEGMEMEALAGGASSIAQHRPAMLIESIKADAAALRGWLAARGYAIFEMGINVLAVHASDPILAAIPGKPIMPEAA